MHPHTSVSDQQMPRRGRKHVRFKITTSDIENAGIGEAENAGARCPW